MAGPWDKYAAPQGGYEIAPPDPYKVEDQQMQREAAERARSAEQRAQAAEQRAQQSAARANRGNTIPPAAATGIQENIKSLDRVKRALAELAARPESIGPGTGALGDTFTQFNDPEGTGVRSTVGKVGAITIHDLSGAAVSATEAPRFQPFVPTVQDRPEVAKTKLLQFQKELEAQIKESLDYYGPSNGYMPYSTPSAQQFLDSVNQGAGGQSGGQAGRLTEEQQQQFFAILQSQGQGPANEYLKSLGYAMKDPSQADKPHSNALDYSGADAQAQARIDALAQEQGTGGGSALRRGAADGMFLGAADEIRAGVESLGGALRGEGSIGDLYGQNLQAEQGYQAQLQQEHPWLYGTGQLAGGLVPGAVTFGASTPGQIAKVGAGVGGVYGFNSGEGGLESRAASAVEGAAAGGALGYAIPKGVQMWQGRKAASSIPDLVDPVTGRLNEPLEAARPGERVAAAKGYGIDLPMGAATDRGGAIIEKGLDNLPGSAGVMNDARRAVEGQVADAADNVAGQFGASRTMNEAGAELQRGAQERIARGNQVIEKAYSAIPIAPTANASTTSTKATLQSLTSRFQSNPDLADALKDPTLNRYLNAVDKGLSWQDLKDFRSIIGEKIGNARFGESSSISDLRALYAGLTEDMKNTAASMGPGALRAFERANGLYRNEQQIIETSLVRILGKDGALAPEKAAAAVQAMTKGGKSTGDLRTLGQIKAATVKSGAWDEIAATLIRLGGQPANSQGRQFSAQTFVQWYADMAPAARAMLFKPELRKSLESFVAVNQRLAGTNALRNTSQTLPNMVGATVVGSTGTAAAMGHPGTLLAMGAGMVGNYGMAKLWTSPAFVQWATGYSRAASTGNANAIRSQIGRLSKLASTNPELRDPLQKLIQSFANDNMAPSVAASQPNQDQQSQ